MRASYRSDRAARSTAWLLIIFVRSEAGSDDPLVTLSEQCVTDVLAEIAVRLDQDR